MASPMLALADDTFALSATDLTDFLACGHLVTQRLAVARGERGRPWPGDDDPHVELIRRRGDAHEAQQLRLLSAECGGHVDLTPARLPRTRAAWEAAAARTAAAMRAGAPLIFQAALFDGRWLGRVDFLRRVDGVEGSSLGGWAYELLDTKLARQVRPAVVHQLSLYSSLLGAVQGVELPDAWVVLGDGRHARVEVGRYGALHRRLRARVQRLVAGPTPASVPEPVAFCEICTLEPECRSLLVDADHLSLVANARRDARDKLVPAGVSTGGALAVLEDDAVVPRLAEERLALLRSQAELQVRSRASGEPTRRHLEPARARGYALLPDPDPGDLFFDLEGDPYVGDGGIEYLWGWCSTDGGEYECVWAHDAEAERLALERFVDLVLARRVTHPGMHVYHYAPHERATLGSLALRYATREDEVDELLRCGVLVDLFAVVRQGVQIGEESYSLKRLERHHGFARLERSVREGGGSIVAYERWLEDRDDAWLEAIRAYNEEDCRSTFALREWLVEALLPEAAASFGVSFDDLREPAPEAPPEPPAWLEEIAPVEASLTSGLAGDPSLDDPDAAGRRLLAQLLRYHQREGKPQYWRFFALKELTPVELQDERDAIGSLVRDTSLAPRPHKQSFDYAFTFPPQEFKLRAGSVVDPETGDSHTLVGISDTRVWLRSSRRRGEPSPRALIPGRPPDPGPLRKAIAAVAQSVLDGDGRFAAVRAVLQRELPALGAAGGAGMPGEDVDSLCAATVALATDGGHLPIQGPPGTGKTYRAARMIVAAIAAGRRVGVTGPSHTAIQNVLTAVEEHAAATGVALRGVYKGEGYESAHGLVVAVDDNAATEGDHDLVAGTAWLLARPAHRARIDVLFVDEAGQMALADCVAAGTCARGIVLLGDPQQLPQVTQADHPGDSGNSALEHLLEGADTIPPDRGVLLTESWRMHPDVCAFVSERSYEGRLRSRDACAVRRVEVAGGCGNGVPAGAGEPAASEAARAPVGANGGSPPPPAHLSGAGLRVLEVEHEGCSQLSEPEADAIAAACRELLAGGATVVEPAAGSADGLPPTDRPLLPSDIMVVAPYNLAVRCIADRVPAGVRVGTVDRFQGREAPVVFFAMTCSTGHDVPRGIDFLFSRNRLNVAISRAQCLAVLVHNPALLDADARTLETMELVDGVCRFAELAQPI